MRLRQAALAIADALNASAAAQAKTGRSFMVSSTAMLSK